MNTTGLKTVGKLLREWRRHLNHLVLYFCAVLSDFSTTAAGFVALAPLILKRKSFTPKISIQPCLGFCLITVNFISLFSTLPKLNSQD
jgi:hypothetical protein